MSFRKNRNNRKAKTVKMVESNKSSINRSARVPDPVTVRVADVEAQADPTKVPTGTAPEIISWVGEDAEKAQRALDLELEDDKPRKGLLTSLQGVIDASAEIADADVSEEAEESKSND